MLGPTAAVSGEHAHRHLVRLPSLPTPNGPLVVGVVLGVLLVFVSADVAICESQPPTVRVTAVERFIPGAPLTTATGFTMHSSEWVTLALTCSTVCFRISGATVESPFTLVSFSVAYHPDQCTNVTVQSRSTSYTGPIAIELNVG